MERSIRNFRIVEKIGTGGMGVIYRAIQTTLDRPVAIKEMHAHLAANPEFIERFEREAKAAAALEHENIVGVIDFGREGDVYFLALEYVDGPDLRVLLDKDPKVVLPVALTVTIDILRGLELAHTRGVVHRDVKPANVMVTRGGVAKIADFSIAQAASLPSMTTTGTTVGTPSYMSPEQAGGGRKLDGRTDVFAAGVILYEMLAGKRPFSGDTYGQVIGQLLTVQPPDLSSIDPVVPPAFARIVARALEKDPEKRYPGAAEFRRDLEQAAREASIPIDRDLVAQYVRSPREFQDALRKRQATEHLHRGLYLLGQGQSHMAEARRCLESAIALDPANEEAKRRLAEIPAGAPAGSAAPAPAPASAAASAGPPEAGRSSILEESRHGGLHVDSVRFLAIGGWVLLALLIAGGGLMATRAVAASRVAARVDALAKSSPEGALEYLDRELARRPWLESLERKRPALEASVRVKELRRKHGSGSWFFGAVREEIFLKHPDDPAVPWAVAAEYEKDLITGVRLYPYKLALERGGPYRDDPRILQAAFEVLGQDRPEVDYAPTAHEILRTWYDEERTEWADRVFVVGTSFDWVNAHAILQDRKDPRASDPVALALRELVDTTGENGDANVRIVVEASDDAKAAHALKLLRALDGPGTIPTRARPFVQEAIRGLEGRIEPITDPEPVAP